MKLFCRPRLGSDKLVGLMPTLPVVVLVGCVLVAGWWVRKRGLKVLALPRLVWPELLVLGVFAAATGIALAWCHTIWAWAVLGAVYGPTIGYLFTGRRWSAACLGLATVVWFFLRARC